MTYCILGVVVGRGEMGLCEEIAVVVVMVVCGESLTGVAGERRVVGWGEVGM